MKHIYTSPLCGWDESADRVLCMNLKAMKKFGTLEK